MPIVQLLQRLKAPGKVLLVMSYELTEIKVAFQNLSLPYERQEKIIHNGKNSLRHLSYNGGNIGDQ